MNVEAVSADGSAIDSGEQLRKLPLAANLEAVPAVKLSTTVADHIVADATEEKTDGTVLRPNVIYDAAIGSRAVAWSAASTLHAVAARGLRGPINRKVSQRRVRDAVGHVNDIAGRERGLEHRPGITGLVVNATPYADDANTVRGRDAT